MRWLHRCSRSATSLILRLNSLFAPKNSLLGLQKFPVSLRREFSCKPLNSLPDWKINREFCRFREFEFGDRFDLECIHHHAVPHSRRFPAGVRKAPNRRGFLNDRVVSETLIGGSGRRIGFFLRLGNPVSRQQRLSPSETRFEWRPIARRSSSSRGLYCRGHKRKLRVDWAR